MRRSGLGTGQREEMEAVETVKKIHIITEIRVYLYAAQPRAQQGQATRMHQGATGLMKREG